MTRTFTRIFAALFSFLTLTILAAAQGPALGAPAFGSVGGGPFDTIDLGNLNVHFAVPIRSKAGRGIPFSYNLTYDSSIWYPGSVNGVSTWQPTAQAGYWGWLGLATQGAISNLTYSIQMTSGNCGQTGQYTWQQWQFKNFIYYDNQGSHNNNFTAYWIQTTGPPSVCPPAGAQPSTAPPSQFTDGSGLTLYALPTGPSSLTWNVTTTSGTTFNNSAGGIATTDANGNQITVSSGVITDTLGQTALTIAGAAPSNTTLQYAAPSTATATYTVSYKSYTVKTNFGCSGIAEYNLSQNLVDKITLPDATSYQFTYEPTAGGITGQVTGRLASVTLPTGGSITYTYPNTASGHNSINCSDGSVATAAGTTPSLTRVVTPGGTSATGTWKYFRALISGNHWQTTITDPTASANQTLLDFQKDNSAVTVNLFETERQVYQGSVGGTVVSTNFTCYNTVNPTPTNCPTATVSTPITRVTSFTCLPNCSGKEAETDMQYGYISSPAFPTEVDTYDYNTGTPVTILQKVITAYSAFGNTVQPTTVTVEDGASNIASQTTYTYDQGSLQMTTSPQHISVTGGRGNLTTIQKQSIGSPATYLYQVLSYYDTGNLYQITDNGTANTGGTNLTTFTYGACGNAFATSISEPLGLSKSFTWDCGGGVMTSATDENNATSNTYYTGTNCSKSADASYWRPYASADQLGNCTTYNYPSLTVAESTLAFNGTASVVDKRITADGFGRPNIAQTEQGFNLSTYDSVETDYDEVGRIYKTTMPYSGTAGATCSSCHPTTTTYDPLDRTTTVTDGGSGSVTYTYTKNDVYQDIGPPPAMEQDKRKQLEYDGLGRLASVCEVTGAGPAVCGQSNNIYTGYWTKYTYDALGDRISVSENSQGTAQTRSFGFDMLGRMTSSQNPESGTVTYTYDTSDATCGFYASAGDLVEKKDAVGNYTCLQYDGLHRLTQITYPVGTYATRTPTKCFKYGAISVGGGTMQNANLRHAEGFTTAAANCSGTPIKIVDEGFSYSARGEPTDVYESTPHSGGYYHSSAAYWANGVVQTLGGIGQQTAYTYGVDGEGRPKTATQGSSNYVTGTTYNTASQPLTVSLKLGDSDNYTYDPNTGRMTNFTFTVGSTPKSMVGNLTWNANGSLAQLAITDGFNGAGTQTCNFGSSTVAGYDDLGRLLSANCGSVWSQTFSYNDAFGNMTKSGSSQWLPGYNTNNRYTLAGTSYDNNGNLLTDTFHTYTWDSDGNTATIDTSTCGTNGTCLTFDASDRVVEKNASGTISEIEYGPVGKGAVMNGATQLQAYVPLPGGEVLSPSPDTFWHSDWLGTVRLASSATARTVTFDRAFAPFGEMYDTVTGGISNPNYTGDTQDTISGEYDTPYRELHPGQGRWISPDPLGAGAVDPANPQSWNRYAYVVNNPLSLFDPMGTCYLASQVWVNVRYGSGYTSNFPGTGIAYDLLYPGACVASPCPGGQMYFVTNGQLSCGSPSQISAQMGNPQTVGGGSSAANNSPKPITCNTTLPNGRTVGSYVSQLSNSFNQQGQAPPVATPFGPAPNPSLPNPISVAFQVYSGTNFRRMFGGPGADYTLLGDAGNFAFFAVSANIGVPLWMAEAAAGVYSVTIHPRSDWVGPFGMDPSATRVVSAGYGAKCD